MRFLFWVPVPCVPSEEGPCSGEDAQSQLLQKKIQRASQVLLVVKNPPANAGELRDMSSIPELGRSLGIGNGNPLQYSCLGHPVDRAYLELVCYSMSSSLQPHGLEPARLLCPWNFPGKSTGVDCHFLLKGIFLTQGLNPHLLWAGIFFTTRATWVQMTQHVVFDNFFFFFWPYCMAYGNLVP